MVPATIHVGDSIVDNSIHLNNSNLAISSPGATQTVGITAETLQALRQFVHDAQQSLSGLGIAADDQEELSDALTGITTELDSPQPRPSKLKGLLGQVGVFIRDTGSSAAGTLLASQIPGLLTMLTG